MTRTAAGAVRVSEVTCWRRLRDWTEAGVFDAVHHLLLDQLRALDRLDLDAAVVDGSHVRAFQGGTDEPLARRSSSARLHLITEGNGIPLAVSLTAETGTTALS